MTFSGWQSLPTALWVPVVVAGVAPVMLGVLTLIALRRRRVTLATRLTCGVVTVFGAALGLWALLSTRAVVDGSLDELARQQLPSVVFLAAELGGRSAADPSLPQRVAPRLTMFLAADARLAFAALTRLKCRVNCTLAVSGDTSSAIGAHLQQPVVALASPAEPIVLHGDQYLIVSAAVRDEAGEPSALLRVALNAESITARASNTVITLVILAWTLLAVVAFVTWRLLRASVSQRVQDLVKRVGDGGPPSVPHTSRSGRDELTELARAIDAGVQASVQRERQQDTQYRELVDNAPWGIGRLDSADRITAANPALAALAGVSDPVALHGRSLQAFFPNPGDASRLVAHRDAVSDTSDAIEALWCGLDGTARTVSVTVRRLDSASEVVIQDVTQRLALEAQLAQSQKMQALSQLTAGIAHDFNNLLTVITASVPLVREQLPPANIILLDDLHRIAEASARGGALVKKLLALGKGDESERQVILVAALLHDIGFLLRRLLPESIALRTPAVLPALRICVDRVGIEQILVNLATNARDAMPSGGVLTLEAYAESVDEPTRAASIGLPRCGAYAVLAVHDSGTGIAPEIQRRVFDPFFTTKPDGRGSGLGLAMVYGLMAQHHGAVTLDSSVGLGTRISLYFPLAAETVDESDARIQIHSHAGHVRRLLLVEDEPDVRRVTRRILESLGYQVEVADDGVDGLARLTQDRSISLVVSDVTMPRMNGPTMLRHARAAAIRVPFVFVTGYSTESLSEIAREDGSVRVLTKPWSATDMARVLSEAVAASE